jgi:phosphoribosylaminoimidazole-succinocarboxamide synthase
MDEAPVERTDLALPDRREGKVRDIYGLPPDRDGVPRLLIVASDRISAFDVVMPTPIPGKGRILTALSAFWMRFIERSGLSATHLLSDDAGLIPGWAFRGARTTPVQLAGRCMIVRRCEVIPVECVVRGYLEGSGWKEYLSAGSVCGVRLPPGLRRCDRLPEPIFTPATKAAKGGHDENITFESAAERVGRSLMERLRARSLAIYAAAAEYALARGIILADTKFEFGIAESGGEPILIDEAITPDSSRFWPMDGYRPGHPQPSFDKQYLREYLEDLVARGLWNREAPGPEIPDAIVRATLARYREAADRLMS